MCETLCLGLGDFSKRNTGGRMEWVWLQCCCFFFNLTWLGGGWGGESYFLQYFCFLFSINISFYPWIFTKIPPDKKILFLIWEFEISVLNVTPFFPKSLKHFNTRTWQKIIITYSHFKQLVGFFFLYNNIINWYIKCSERWMQQVEGFIFFL